MIPLDGSLFGIFFASLSPNGLQAQETQSFIGEVIFIGASRDDGWIQNLFDQLLGPQRAAGQSRHEAAIRDMVDLWPGQKLNDADVKVAETKLVESGLFKVDADAGIRPTIQVLDSAGPFKDIVIKVEILPPDPMVCIGSTALLLAIAIAAMFLATAMFRRRIHRAPGEYLAKAKTKPAPERIET